MLGRWLGVFLVVMLLLTCQRRVQPPDAIAIPTDSTGQTIIIDNTPITVPAQPQVLVEVVRTGCYGKCPAFSFQLLSNGQATLNGQAHVPLVGRYELTSVRSSALDSLWQAVAQADFFTLADSFPVGGHPIPDLPTTTTTVRGRDGLKTIVDNHGAPLALQHLEEFMRSWVFGLGWDQD